MSIKRFLSKIRRITIQRIFGLIYSRIRILKYKLLSDCKQISGKPNFNSPALINGKGKVYFDRNVFLGVTKSPYFFNSYIYIESRSPNSIIEIGSGVWINNNSILISDGPGIKIGENTLIGFNFSVYDTDFHDLHPDRRVTGIPLSAKVVIGSNVFIGSSVTVLKGVEIGSNSVIANGAVVTKSIPSNVIAGGNPCRVIKELIIKQS